MVENGSRKWGEEYGVSDVLCDLDDMQSADVVSREAYEQIKWERDTAIAQLKELGYGLGEEIKP